MIRHSGHVYHIELSDDGKCIMLGIAMDHDQYEYDYDTKIMLPIEIARQYINEISDLVSAYECVNKNFDNIRKIVDGKLQKSDKEAVEEELRALTTSLVPSLLKESDDRTE